jgi:hypothetical protein
LLKKDVSVMAIGSQCTELAVVFVAAVFVIIASSILAAVALRGRIANRGRFNKLVYPLYLFRGELFRNGNNGTRYMAATLLVVGAILLIAAGAPVGAAYVEGRNGICGLSF